LQRWFLMVLMDCTRFHRFCCTPRFSSSTVAHKAIQRTSTESQPNKTTPAKNITLDKQGLRASEQPKCKVPAGIYCSGARHSIRISKQTCFLQSGSSSIDRNINQSSLSRRLEDSIPSLCLLVGLSKMFDPSASFLSRRHRSGVLSLKMLKHVLAIPGGLQPVLNASQGLSCYGTCGAWGFNEHAHNMSPKLASG